MSTSYRQTIYAYPDGGGAYVVSRENISQTAGLVAGASLLVDYTLTVAVSVSSGVLAIGSAFHFNDNATLRVGLALWSSWPCWRSATCAASRRRAGSSPSPPTPTPLLLGGLIAYGIYQIGFQDLGTIPGNEELANEFAEEHGADVATLTGSVGLILLLRAFSSGAVVLAGVEAMSNGVPAFRKPKSKNASQTLIMMAVILGVAAPSASSYLASHLHPVFDEGGDTVLSQMGGAIFGSGTRPLLRPPVRHLRHPDPGGQHRVRRLPAAVVEHRPGRLPAPPARQPRRSAGVLERRADPVGHGRRC